MRLFSFPAHADQPSWKISVLPVALLLLCLALVICLFGPDKISEFSPYILLLAAAFALVLGLKARSVCRRGMTTGFMRSVRQILPAVPMLLCIAALSTTWMLSGVVPTLVDYGLAVLNPRLFLLVACMACAMISVLTGSSWSTIATIGVAFMGIGSLMGYSAGWVAGAVISGAYFGDKISPLSDTTVVASSTCGVDLFDHIRYLLITAIPAMSLALLVFGVRGLWSDPSVGSDSPMFINLLHEQYNITPWVMIIPALTITLIALRVNTLTVLATSAMMGAAGIWIFQPQLGMSVIEVGSSVLSGNASASGDEMLDALLSTGGITGMLPTIFLVLSAMVFGGVLIGTGMLGSIARAITSRIKRRTSVVGATVGSGLCINAFTADQYLALIITGNMFRNVYRRSALEMRLLSRSIEDSVSVTSVLIPWNSCGVTQSTVLGVSTLTYLPYCVFNYLTPLMSLVMIWTGFKVRSLAGMAVGRAS